jgi:hypothetical protein
VFNPDISVNGNFVGAAGRNPFATLSPMQLSEVEAAFQAIVDPYARADFFVAVGPDGAEVEEGYITFTSLPANLLLKAGKLRANFGKMNTLHTHALPSVDRPLVTENWWGATRASPTPACRCRISSTTRCCTWSSPVRCLPAWGMYFTA